MFYLFWLKAILFYMIISLVFVQVIVQQVMTASVAPTWVTNSLVKAGQGNLVNGVKTSSNSIPPTATMTFSSAFSALPNLGYGIMNY
jgi:hypothetical protein